MIRIDVALLGGLDGPFERLDELDSIVQDTLDIVAAAQLARLRKRFLDQQAPDGTTWPESRAAMVRRIAGRDGGTLFDTGSLFHSLNIIPKTGMERAVGVVPGTKNRETGADVETYGRIHQLGLNGAPVRMFIGFSQDDPRDLTELADMYLRRRLGL